MLSTYVVSRLTCQTLPCPQFVWSTGATRATLRAVPKLRRITDMPVAERPREKMQRQGAAALSDFELFEVLIGNGAARTSVGQLARNLQRLLYEHGGNVTLEQLKEIKGISSATASRVLGALELARRHLVRDLLPLRTQEEILGRLGDIRTLPQEHFICLSLDGGQRLISRRTITIGLLDSVQAHPREVFADAIADRAASVILAHNHPSGDTKPSRHDVTCTQQLAAAGQLLGIPLRDHFILTKTGHFSFAQHHLY